MKIKLLDTKEEFEKLKKGDSILVKWSKCWVRHTPGAKRIMLYSIYENKVNQEEIICRMRNNHFFNYERYLEKTSGALEVYKVEE